MAAGAAVKGVGGKKGCSGRKSRAEEAGLAYLLNECWTVADRKEVIRTLHRNAKAGNEKAAALLLAYTYGKPHETITATVTHRDFEVEIGGTFADDQPVNGQAEFVN